MYSSRSARKQATQAAVDVVAVVRARKVVHPLLGKVESGMDHVDAIKKGDEAQNGVVEDPDRMIKVRIAADK